MSSTSKVFDMFVINVSKLIDFHVSSKNHSYPFSLEGKVSFFITCITYPGKWGKCNSAWFSKLSKNICNSGHDAFTIWRKGLDKVHNCDCVLNHEGKKKELPNQKMSRASLHFWKNKLMTCQNYSIKNWCTDFENIWLQSLLISTTFLKDKS